MTSLGERLIEQMRLAGTRTVLGSLCGHTGISGLQTADLVMAGAAELQALDDGAIAIAAHNGPGWIIADIACLVADRCTVPLPQFFSSAQIAHAMSDADVRYLLADAGAAAPEGFRRCHDIVWAPNQQALTLWKNSVSVASEIPLHTQKITYTSGSTGTPKGVCLSVQQLDSVIRALDDALSDVEIARHLSVLPLTTLLENVAGVYLPLLRGARVITFSPQSGEGSASVTTDPRRFLEMIRQSQANSMILVPQLLQLLVAGVERGWQKPASLSFIAVGGGKVSRKLLEQAWKVGLPVYEGYGLSECASVVSLNTPDSHRLGSCGRPLAHVQLGFSDGEVQVAGNCFLGYTNSLLNLGQDAEFSTGDLGYLDDDGYLYINGRRKNILISSYGRNISPEWVESELNALPGVLCSIVLGDGQPHCSALIYVQPGTDASRLSGQIQQLNQSLPDYARIQNWDELERPFSAQKSEITPDGRLRRDVIAKNFKAAIDDLLARGVDESQRFTVPLQVADA